MTFCSRYGNVVSEPNVPPPSRPLWSTPVVFPRAENHSGNGFRTFFGGRAVGICKPKLAAKGPAEDRGLFGAHFVDRSPTAWPQNRPKTGPGRIFAKPAALYVTWSYEKTVSEFVALQDGAKIDHWWPWGRNSPRAQRSTLVPPGAPRTQVPWVPFSRPQIRTSPILPQHPLRRGPTCNTVVAINACVVVVLPSSSSPRRSEPASSSSSRGFLVSCTVTTSPPS